MGVFVTIDDFKEEGRYNIPVNLGKEEELDNIITKHEKTILVELLGVTMGEALYNDVALFPELVEPFYLQNDRCLVKSEGVKVMLMGLIYFYYVRMQFGGVTTVGVSRNMGENSDNLQTNSFDLVGRYNEGVENYKSIQYKALQDLATYPYFMGITKEIALPL